MIDVAALMVVENLKIFMKERSTLTVEDVVLGNVASIDSAGPELGMLDMNDKIIGTVVNIAEEAVFKNFSNSSRENAGGSRQKQPPAFLNLFLLFSANYTNYIKGLKKLSHVVEFFQSQRVFSPIETPISGIEDSDLRVVLELFTLTFEQANYLWSSLGGKQLPCVLYKLRVVKIQPNRLKKPDRFIREIDGEFKDTVSGG